MRRNAKLPAQFTYVREKTSNLSKKKSQNEFSYYKLIFKKF